MFQSFYKMFGKWTQVQTYGEANKFKYIEKNHPQIWQNIEISPQWEPAPDPKYQNV